MQNEMGYRSDQRTHTRKDDFVVLPLLLVDGVNYLLALFSPFFSLHTIGRSKERINEQFTAYTGVHSKTKRF